MATPSYTEDLADITTAESITNWVALGGGASGLGAGVDFAMEGTNCVDKQVSGAEKGQVYNFGSTITPGTDTHFLVWVFLATPGLTATLANRGLAIVMGTATNAYNAFHVEGSDTYGAVGRVGKCYPIRYVTTSNGSVPYRTLTGSPGANPQYFGATANITGSVKSSNLGVDAIRYGTGIYITAGDSGTPATFAGAATANDALSARWGILSFVAGSNYELQGRFVIGQDNTYTPTLAYFSDSNKNILLVDTPHSLTNFTQIIIDHASTVFNLTNITIEAAGTNNPGRLVYNNASTSSTLTGCSFIKMGIFTLRALVTATNCTWRQCGQITLNGATITNSTISNSPATSAVLAATPAGAALVSGTDFTSAGTGHAIEVTGTAANFTLTNNTYTGYGADGTSNAAVYVNIATGSLNLTISGGNVPTIRTAGCNVTVVTSARTVKVVVTSVDGPVTGANVYLVADAGGPFPSNVAINSITRFGTTATVTHPTAHGLATNDQMNISGITDKIEDNGVHTITYINATQYSYTTTDSGSTNYFGTIKATFVFLKGLATAGTNSNEISMTRTIPSDQPVTGWARKSSNPYYKEGAISGTVSSSGDTTFSPVLISDD